MTKTSKDADNKPKSRPVIDPKMLGVLVCPKTKGPLVYDAEKNELISKKAGLAYPIRDGVPIMLESSARKIKD